MSAQPLLELRNVTVVRGSNIALRDVRLSIGAGEHVAILGRTAAANRGW